MSEVNGAVPTNKELQNWRHIKEPESSNCSSEVNMLLSTNAWLSAKRLTMHLTSTKSYVEIKDDVFAQRLRKTAPNKTKVMQYAVHSLVEGSRAIFDSAFGKKPIPPGHRLSTSPIHKDGLPTTLSVSTALIHICRNTPNLCRVNPEYLQ
ncbi:hypothetical protein PHET_09109 [Paragonimus heterotremus]|uniref:Uncharacterized protein n=1 Tax=Paragonimus heterotremus TaxID=100268 RepID=A0A8J4WF35_9TREM|nr:hypothetical protein PHET_09109 [Paragonimus heterotremus]